MPNRLQLAVLHKASGDGIESAQFLECAQDARRRSPIAPADIRDREHAKPGGKRLADRGGKIYRGDNFIKVFQIVR